MHFAFWKGLELLNSQETDAIQSQVQRVESPSKSTSKHIEGMKVIPKNVALLEPVMDNLMCKVIVISI